MNGMLARPMVPFSQCNDANSIHRHFVGEQLTLRTSSKCFLEEQLIALPCAEGGRGRAGSRLTVFTNVFAMYKECHRAELGDNGLILCPFLQHQTTYLTVIYVHFSDYKVRIRMLR